jgi:hypothetical protein
MALIELNKNRQARFFAKEQYRRNGKIISRQQGEIVYDFADHTQNGIKSVAVFLKPMKFAMYYLQMKLFVCQPRRSYLNLGIK